MSNMHSFRAIEYMKYLSNRRGIQYIHSPFLFNLMKVVFNDSKKGWPDTFFRIEEQRNKLMKDTSNFEFEDFGAGGDQLRKREVSISSIAAKALKQAKYARFLFRLAQHINAKNIVELGTSLGLTTSYLASVQPNVNVFTIEADRKVQAVAKQNWMYLKIDQIKPYCFDLNEQWDFLAERINRIDLLFVDANHRKEAMIRYVLSALPYIHDNSVIVLDDIYWNKETMEAWNLLKLRNEVTLSFDIFQMGFLFFDKNLSRESFRLKY